MNYATIKWTDIANGEGVRISLFVSGCTHRCKNCFNEIAWDFSYGEPFTEEVEEKILKEFASDYIAGLSLLGGEPLEPQNQEALYPFVKKVKEQYPQKTVWCYTGYELDTELLSGKAGDTETVRRMLSCIDVLVDGRYIEALHDITLLFRGSSNQRLIDLRRTEEAGKVVLWEKQI